MSTHERGDQPPRNKDEQMRPWEIGPDAKELFDDTYAAILAQPEARHAMLRALLSPRVTYHEGIPTEHAVEQEFEVPIGKTLWEISGSLPKDSPRDFRELNLRKKNPNALRLDPKYTDGFLVWVKLGPKREPQDPDTHWGSVGAYGVAVDTQEALDRARKLLKEFSDTPATS